MTSGAKMLVFLDPPLVFRFPRYAEEACQIEELGDRYARARELGFPAPPVHRCVAGRVGNAHMVLQWRPGQETRDLVAGLDWRGLRRMTDALGDLLTDLAGVQSESWPYPQPAWQASWGELPRRLARMAMSIEVPPDWIRAAEAAADLALVAPLSLMHSDIGGVNVLFDDEQRISAVLDWDGAIVGDPANDAAAVLHHLPPAGIDRMRRRFPEIAEAADRFKIYGATWPAQAALWEFERASGDTGGPVLDADPRSGDGT